MRMQTPSGEIVQPFTTKLPIETIDLLKYKAAAQKKSVYKLLDEIIIEHLSDSDSEHDNLRKSAK